MIKRFSEWLFYRLHEGNIPAEFPSPARIAVIFVDNMRGDVMVMRRWAQMKKADISLLYATTGNRILWGFGMWDPRNPYIELNPEVSSGGVITEPLYPYNITKVLLPIVQLECRARLRMIGEVW